MSKLLHIPCSACTALNRIPAERLDDGPNCGSCKTPLLSKRPIELNAKNFAAITQKSDLPVVVDFWAPWCGPCKMMAPAFASAAEAFCKRALLAKLNTEDAPALGTKFNIRSIPTLLVFKSGSEIARQSGALDRANLTQFIERHLP